jgi:hypothetical protein
MTRALPLAALLALASGCAGPPVPSPVEDLPICPDFEAGKTKMEGSLRHPVRMRVTEGKAQISKLVISGLRKPDDAKPRTFIVDDNAEYAVEWAQCANERAPRTATEVAKDTAKAREKLRETETGYECGEVKVYKTDKLVTKKHDPASHVIHFAPPPDAECWKPAAPPPPPPAAPSAVVDAGAAPVDAGAAATDAGPPAADAGK